MGFCLNLKRGTCMKIKFSFLLPVILSIMVQSAFCGCGYSKDVKSGVIDLSGKWRIIETDVPGNSSPVFDDLKYPEISIPGNWLDVLKKNEELAATVWISKKVFIQKENLMKQPVLFIERVAIADEAYINGIKIGSSGVIPVSPGDLHYQISWYTPRIYFIPDNVLKYGQENVITLRVYSHIQSGIMGEIAINDYYRDYFAHTVKSSMALFISIAAIVMNLILILVFTLLFISEKKKTEYLYFTFAIIFTLICFLLAFPLPVMMGGLWRYKLFVFFYTVTSFFVLHGVKKFLSVDSRIINYVSLALLVAVELSVLLAPGSRFLAFYSGFACLFFVNFCILTSSVLFINAVRRDPRRYWYFLFLAIPVPVSVMRNSYYFFSYRFNELPLVIFLHIPLVFMFFTLYFIYDFEKSRKEKDILYAALLKKAKNDNRLLNSIRNKNKKPDPRDIITDVIEYLDSNYAEKYDRIELSKKFGLNEDYMGQIFKKATGTNISNYINTSRINAARELLVDTDVKVIDIAYHVGFDNLTHFHRQFKIHTGSTPNEYRQKMKSRQPTDVEA